LYNSVRKQLGLLTTRDGEIHQKDKTPKKHQIQTTFAISGAALFRHHSELGANSVCQAMPRSKCFAALALALTARTACEETALGGLGLPGRNLVSVLVAFVDYQKNWNASLVMRLGPPHSRNSWWCASKCKLNQLARQGDTRIAGSGNGQCFGPHDWSDR
jgi:hypothetical protein